MLCRGRKLDACRDAVVHVTTGNEAGPRYVPPGDRKDNVQSPLSPGGFVRCARRAPPLDEAAQTADPQASSPDTTPTATALSAEGVFAGLFGPDTDGAHGGVRVIGVTPVGKQQVLDEAAAGDAIPVSSLAVTGRTVTRTNNGAPKSAEL